ncbi:mucin-5AC-like [Dermacentor albipictus]|uniref:mucin-5AC-like n=1 Tax=Dermacentor albipictus TaxID=60249 RepID=UPI0031FD0032
MQPYAALPTEQVHAVQIPKQSSNTLIATGPGISEEARAVPRNIAIFEKTRASMRFPAKHSTKASADMLQEVPRYVQSPQIPQNLESHRGGTPYGVQPSSEAEIPGKVPDAYFMGAASTRKSRRSFNVRVRRAVPDIGTLLPLQNGSTLQRNVSHAVVPTLSRATMPFESVPEKQQILTGRGAAKQHVGLSPVEQGNMVNMRNPLLTAQGYSTAKEAITLSKTTRINQEATTNLQSSESPKPEPTNKIIARTMSQARFLRPPFSRSFAEIVPTERPTMLWSGAEKGTAGLPLPNTKNVNGVSTSRVVLPSKFYRISPLETQKSAESTRVVMSQQTLPASQAVSKEKRLELHIPSMWLKKPHVETPLGTSLRPTTQLTGRKLVTLPVVRTMGTLGGKTPGTVHPGYQQSTPPFNILPQEPSTSTSTAVHHEIHSKSKVVIKNAFPDKRSPHAKYTKTSITAKPERPQTFMVLGTGKRPGILQTPQREAYGQNTSPTVVLNKGILQTTSGTLLNKPPFLASHGAVQRPAVAPPAKITNLQTVQHSKYTRNVSTMDAMRAPSKKSFLLNKETNEKTTRQPHFTAESKKHKNKKKQFSTGSLPPKAPGNAYVTTAQMASTLISNRPVNAAEMNLAPSVQASDANNAPRTIHQVKRTNVGTSGTFSDGPAIFKSVPTVKAPGTLETKPHIPRKERALASAVLGPNQNIERSFATLQQVRLHSANQEVIKKSKHHDLNFHSNQQPVKGKKKNSNSPVRSTQAQTAPCPIVPAKPAVSYETGTAPQIPSTATRETEKNAWEVHQARIHPSTTREGATLGASHIRRTDITNANKKRTSKIVTNDTRAHGAVVSSLPSIPKPAGGPSHRQSHAGFNATYRITDTVLERADTKATSTATKRLPANIPKKAPATIETTTKTRLRSSQSVQINNAMVNGRLNTGQISQSRGTLPHRQIITPQPGTLPQKHSSAKHSQVTFGGASHTTKKVGTNITRIHEATVPSVITKQKEAGGLRAKHSHSDFNRTVTAAGYVVMSVGNKTKAAASYRPAKVTPKKVSASTMTMAKTISRSSQSLKANKTSVNNALKKNQGSAPRRAALPKQTNISMAGIVPQKPYVPTNGAVTSGGTTHTTEKVVKNVTRVRIAAVPSVPTKQKYTGGISPAQSLPDFNGTLTAAGTVQPGSDTKAKTPATQRPAAETPRKVPAPTPTTVKTVSTSSQSVHINKTTLDIPLNSGKASIPGVALTPKKSSIYEPGTVPQKPSAPTSRGLTTGEATMEKVVTNVTTVLGAAGPSIVAKPTTDGGLPKKPATSDLNRIVAAVGTAQPGAHTRMKTAATQRPETATPIKVIPATATTVKTLSRSSQSIQTNKRALKRPVNTGKESVPRIPFPPKQSSIFEPRTVPRNPSVQPKRVVTSGEASHTTEKVVTNYTRVLEGAVPSMPAKPKPAGGLLQKQAPSDLNRMVTAAGTTKPGAHTRLKSAVTNRPAVATPMKASTATITTEKTASRSSQSVQTKKTALNNPINKGKGSVPRIALPPKQSRISPHRTVPRNPSARPHGGVTSGEATHTAVNVVTNFTRVFGGTVPSIPTKPKQAAGLSQKQAPSDLNRMVTTAGTVQTGAHTRVKPAATKRPEAATPMKASTATIKTEKRVSRSSQSVQTNNTAFNSPVNKGKGSVPRIALPPKQSSVSQHRTVPRNPSVPPHGGVTSGEATHTTEKIVTNFTRVFGGAVPSIPTKPKPAAGLSQKQAPSDWNIMVTAEGSAPPGAHTRLKPAVTNRAEVATPMKASTATITTEKTVSRSSQSVQTKKTALNNPVNKVKGSIPRIALPPMQSSISPHRTVPRNPSVPPRGRVTSGEATHTVVKVVTNFTRGFGGAVPSTPTKPKPAAGLSQKQAPSDFNRMVTTAGTVQPGAHTTVKSAATNRSAVAPPAKASKATRTTEKTVSRSSQSVQTKKTALNNPVNKVKGSIPRIASPPMQSSISPHRTMPPNPSVPPHGGVTSGEATHTAVKVVTNFTRGFGGAVPSIPTKPKPAAGLSQKQAPSDLNRTVTTVGTVQPGAHTRVKPAATKRPAVAAPMRASTATITTEKTVSRSLQSVQTKKTALNNPVNKGKGSVPRIALPPKQSSISPHRTVPRNPSAPPHGGVTSGEATHTAVKVVTNFTRVFGGAVPSIPTKPKPAAGLSQKQAPSDLNRMVTTAGTVQPGAHTRVKPAATKRPEAATPMEASTATIKTEKRVSRSSQSVQTNNTAFNSPVNKGKGSVPRIALPPKQSSVSQHRTVPRNPSVPPHGGVTSGEATHTTEKIVTNFTRVFGGAVPSIPTQPKPAAGLSQKQAPSNWNVMVTAEGSAPPGAHTSLKPAVTIRPEVATPMKASTATITTEKTVSRSSHSVQTKKIALNKPVNKGKGSVPRIALPPMQSSISPHRTVPRNPSLPPHGRVTSGEATHTAVKVVTNFTRGFGGAVPSTPTKPTPAAGLSQKQAPSDFNRMVTTAGTVQPGAPTWVKPAATNRPEAATPVKAPTAIITTEKTVSRSSQSAQTEKTAWNSPEHKRKGSVPRIALPPKQSSISKHRTVPRNPSVPPHGGLTSGEATHSTEKVVANFTRVFEGAVPTIPIKSKPAAGLSQKQAPSDLNRMVTRAGTAQPGAHTRVKPATTKRPEAATPMKASTATIKTEKRVSRSSQSIQTNTTALNSPVNKGKGSVPRIALPPKQSSVSQHRTVPRNPSLPPHGGVTSGEATHTTEKIVTNFTRVFGGAVPSIPTKPKPAAGLSQKQGHSPFNRMVTTAGPAQPGAHTRVKPPAINRPEAATPVKLSTATITTAKTVSRSSQSVQTQKTAWNSPEHKRKGSVPRIALPPKQSSISPHGSVPRNRSVPPHGGVTSGQATHTTVKEVTNLKRVFGGAVPSIPTKPKPARGLSQTQGRSPSNRMVTTAGPAQPGAHTRVKPAATSRPAVVTPMRASTATITTEKIVSRSSQTVQIKKKALNNPVNKGKGSVPRIALPPKQSSISQHRTVPRNPSVPPHGGVTSGEATHTAVKEVTNFTRVFGGAVPSIPTEPKPAAGLSQKPGRSPLNRTVTAGGMVQPGAHTRVRLAATNRPAAATHMQASTATITTGETVSRSSQSVQTKKTASNSPEHKGKGSVPRIALPPNQSSISQHRTVPRNPFVPPHGGATSGEATHITEKVVANFTRVFGGAVPTIPTKPKPAAGLSQKQGPSPLNRMVTAAGTAQPGAHTRVKPAATNRPAVAPPMKASTATITAAKTVSRSSQSVQTQKTAWNSPEHKRKGSVPRIALPPKQSSISPHGTVPRNPSVPSHGGVTSGEATHTTEKVVTNFTRLFGGAVPSIPTKPKPAGGLSQKQGPSGSHSIASVAGSVLRGADLKGKPVTIHRPAAKSPRKVPATSDSKAETEKQPPHRVGESDISRMQSSLEEPSKKNRSGSEKTTRKSISQTISETRGSVLKVRPTTLMTINATTASHVTLNQAWPQHVGVGQLLMTTSTIENKTIGIPLAPPSGKTSITVPAAQRDATVSNNAFSSALMQMLLLRILGRVSATSPSAVISRELLPSFTGEPAVASKPIARETVPKASFVEGHKCDEEALANARAALSGLQPILERKNTTTTITTFLRAPGGRIFNVTDVVSSSTTILPIGKMSAATIHNQSTAMPSYFKNVHKPMTEMQQRVTGQASQLEPSLSEMQTKGQPCRLQPPVPPVLNCRFTCDNHKDNERYETEKDGTPCHLHRRVRSLIGVCVRGQCQQIANK